MFKQKKILSFTAILMLLASCNPKVPTPNPETPNSETPNSGTPTDIPVPNFGSGPIFTVDRLFDFSSSLVKPFGTGFYRLHYVPVRAFEQYKEEVLKAGLWQNKKGRVMSDIAFNTDPIGFNVAVDIDGSHLPIRFDFSNPQSPKVQDTKKSYNIKRTALNTTFDRWSSQDFDIKEHNASASEVYRIYPNEEFYVIIVAIAPDVTFEKILYLPININGLAHSTYILQE